MQNWRNEGDDGMEREAREAREREDRTERARRERERGLHFQDDYDLDRTRRGSGYGGDRGGRDGQPDRQWAPGGARGEQQATAQERYRPSWSWDPPPPARDPYDRRDAYVPFERRDAYPPPERRDAYEPYPPRREAYGGQYEGRPPPADDDYREPYVPLVPPSPHQRHHAGVFQRFKELIGKGPKGYRRSDDRILEEVHERLAHGYLDASDIEVKVKDGEVTLEGTVRSKHDRRLAEDLVEDTLGVRELDNRLKVRKADASPPRL
jgi:hypothetical protein